MEAGEVFWVGVCHASTARRHLQRDECSLQCDSGCALLPIQIRCNIGGQLAEELMPENERVQVLAFYIIVTPAPAELTRLNPRNADPADPELNVRPPNC